MNLITIGGWIFWSILIIAFLCIVASIEDRGKAEIGTPTIVLVVLGMLFFVLCRDIYTNLFQNVQFNTSTTLSIIGGYLICGVFWSFFKWWQYVKTQALLYHDRLKRYANTDPNDYKPLVSENKGQISAWILYFPFSLIRYAIGNLLKDLMNWIVESFSKWYDMITDSHFTKVKE